MKKIFLFFFCGRSFGWILPKKKLLTFFAVFSFLQSKQSALTLPLATLFTWSRHRVECNKRKFFDRKTISHILLLFWGLEECFWSKVHRNFSFSEMKMRKIERKQTEGSNHDSVADFYSAFSFDSRPCFYCWKNSITIPTKPKQVEFFLHNCESNFNFKLHKSKLLSLALFAMSVFLIVQTTEPHSEMLFHQQPQWGDVSAYQNTTKQHKTSNLEYEISSTKQQPLPLPNMRLLKNEMNTKVVKINPQINSPRDPLNVRLE